MYRKIFFSFTFVSILTLILSACATTIQHTALMPPRCPEASTIKEIAVLPFDGKNGKEFAAEIEGTIAAINIGDRQYFKLVERNKLDKILSEMKFSQSGMVDERTAVKIGKMIGAKGLITGRINITSNEKPYSENRKYCVERKKSDTLNKSDKLSSLLVDVASTALDLDCIKWEMKTIECFERSALIQFTPKLIDIETGKIIYSRNFSDLATSKGCVDKKIPETIDELVSKIKLKAKEEFRKDIAPYYVTMELNLMDSKDGITAKEAEKKFEQGLDFAKHQRLDRACEFWGEARILSPNSPSILYNLGICSEVTGDIEKALDLYKKADKNMTKPDDRLTVALKRVEEIVNKQKIIKETLESNEKTKIASQRSYSEKFSNQTNNLQTSNTYLIVSKPTRLRLEANTKSKVIKNLKKGEKVEKINDTKNWVNVRLSSGEIGWVHKSMVIEDNINITDNK